MKVKLEFSLLLLFKECSLFTTQINNHFAVEYLEPGLRIWKHQWLNYNICEYLRSSLVSGLYCGSITLLHCVFEQAVMRIGKVFTA